MGYFDDHLKTTENHQTYGEHFKVAFHGSLKLFGAAVAGLIHSFWPHAYPFYTSMKVTELFKVLVDTKRHKREINETFYKDRYFLDKDSKPDPGVYIKVGELSDDEFDN